MDGTIIGQGTFTAKPIAASGLGAIETYAQPVIIQVPSAADWVKVTNLNQWAISGTNTANFQGNANAFVGFEFFWQRSPFFTPGVCLVSYKANGTNVVNSEVLVSGGITIYDPTGQSAGSLPTLGNPVATTNSTNAPQPVVSTGITTGISVGTVVRISNTAQTDVNGIDMVVSDVNDGADFTLLFAGNALANAPGIAGGVGFYRIVNTDPLFYPRSRYVTNITSAANAQVSTSVDHQYVAGQSIRFNIPAVSGMTQLNSTPQNNYRTVTVVSVIDSYNFTIDVDTTAFTAFTWPLASQQPSNFPEVSPVGENTAAALASLQPQTPLDVFGNQINATNTGILSDSTVNTGFLGLILGSGGETSLGSIVVGPAGAGTTSNAGVITQPNAMAWIAGKSTYGGL